MNTFLAESVRLPVTGANLRRGIRNSSFGCLALSAIFCCSAAIFFCSSVKVGWAQPASPPLSDSLPNCSGMAALGADHYLVTHDLKDGQPGARLGIVHTKGRIQYQPVEIAWGSVMANDVESICPVAGAAGQFLLCESGYYKGRYGRIFHVEIGPDGRGRLLGEMHLPSGLQQDIEGIATEEMPSGGWMVLLGGRGGKEGQPGRLYWGQWAKGGSEIQWTKDGVTGQALQIPRRLGPFARALSDMYLDAQGGLYVSSCTAPGTPYPSRSLIFLAGHVKADLKHPFKAETEPAVWWIDGCKIEGIAPSNKSGCGPAFVTDDDDLGGVWRVTPINPSLTY